MSVYDLFGFGNVAPGVPLDRGGISNGLDPSWQAGGMNEIAFMSWLDQFLNVALAEFEWSGLPDKVEARWIETCLMFRGNAVLFDMSGDRSGLFAVQPASSMAPLNMYGNPTEVLITPVNGAPIGPWTRHASHWGDPLSEPDCAICFDSLTRYPTITTLAYYARSCAELDRELDLHLSQLVGPWIAETDERQRGALVNAFKQITGHEPLVVTSNRSTITDGLRVFDTRVEYRGTDLLDAQARRADQAMSRIGVQNGFTNKKERLIQKEQSANDEQIMLIRQSRKSCRELFCEQANALFGLNMSVRWRVDRDADGNVDMGEGESYAGEASREDGSELPVLS